MVCHYIGLKTQWANPGIFSDPQMSLLKLPLLSGAGDLLSQGPCVCVKSFPSQSIAHKEQLGRWPLGSAPFLQQITADRLLCTGPVLDSAAVVMG